MITNIQDLNAYLEWAERNGLRPIVLQGKLEHRDLIKDDDGSPSVAMYRGWQLRKRSWLEWELDLTMFTRVMVAAWVVDQNIEYLLPREANGTISVKENAETLTEEEGGAQRHERR